MKILYAAVGFAGVIVAGSAYAGPGPGVLPSSNGGTAIFSSFVTNSFDDSSIALHSPIPGVQGGVPVAQQFTTSSTYTLTGLTFELSAPAGTASNLSVYLVPNGGSNEPSNDGGSPPSLTNATPLGTILASSIPTTSGAVKLAIDDLLTAGTYWIALESSSSTTGDLWYRTGDQIGLDVGNNVDNTDAGLYNTHVSGSSPPPVGMAFKDNDTVALELQIDVPEPASLALLGAGLMGLGFVRRRRFGKTGG